MTDKIDDGGAAFPRSAFSPGYSSRFENDAAKGASVRDYFAAHAPITVQDAISVQAPNKHLADLSYPEIKLIMETLAGIRFAYADAMIAARKGGA